MQSVTRTSTVLRMASHPTRIMTRTPRSNPGIFFSTTSSSVGPNQDTKEEETPPPVPEGILARSKHQILSAVFTPQNQFYALVAGGTVGAYIVSRGVLQFTSFFTHLTPTVVAKWGFYTGFGTASVLGGLAMVTADNLYIRADPVYRYCSNWVMNDARVQASLGDGIQPGNLRSYRLDTGKIQLENGSPVWKPPRIQMIFDVSATGPPYRTGLVTCEVVKGAGRWYWPQLQTTLLKVDYEFGNEHEGGSTEGDATLYLVGTEKEVTRVSKRTGLSLEMLARSVHINRAAALGTKKKLEV